MKYKLTIFALLILPYQIIAQVSLSDNNIYCTQYSEILNYIKTDSLTNRIFNFSEYKFKIDTKVVGGIGSFYMIHYYIANLLKIPVDQLNFNDSLINRFYNLTLIEDQLLRSYSANSNCLEVLQKDNSGHNIELSFYRKNEYIVTVGAYAKSNYNLITYLFYFDKTILRKTYKYTTNLHID